MRACATGSAGITGVAVGAGGVNGTAETVGPGGGDDSQMYVVEVEGAENTVVDAVGVASW